MEAVGAVSKAEHPALSEDDVAAEQHSMDHRRSPMNQLINYLYDERSAHIRR